MDKHNYFVRKSIGQNVIVSHRLDQISRFWEKCKAERERALDRELRHLSNHLSALETERGLSKQDFNELKKLMKELERAENETVPGTWILGNLVERHFFIADCKLKIDRLLKKSRLHRYSEPTAELHHWHQPSKQGAGPPARSAHDVALGIIDLENKSHGPRPMTDVIPVDVKQELKPSSFLKHHESAVITAKPEHGAPNSKLPTTGSTSKMKSLKSPSTTSKHVAFKDVKDEDVAEPRPKGRQLERSSMLYHSTEKRAEEKGIKGLEPLKKLAVSSAPALIPKPLDKQITKESLMSHSSYEPREALRKHALLVSKKAIPEAPKLEYNTLQNYYDYMSTAPSSSGIKREHLAKGSVGRYTSERNERRRMLAIQSVLEKVYDYRITKNMIHPRDALNCRYLRLTPQNVAELEEQCRLRGIDPGLHAFSTEEDVKDFFKKMDQNKE